jgi:alanyl-tRNA synthetase
VDETADIGVFIITGEGSTAAGIRRIEAVTGWRAYELIQKRFLTIKHVSHMLGVAPEEIPHKAAEILENLNHAKKEISELRHELASKEFVQHLVSVQTIKGVPVLAARLPDADIDTLREMTDRFRQKYPTGVAVLATVSKDERPVVIATITEDLIQRGLHAGELVKHIATPLGGSGGGRPTLAQAGGKDASQLDKALTMARQWVEEHLK